MNEEGLLSRIANALHVSEEDDVQPEYLDAVDTLREDLRKATAAEDPHTALEAALSTFRSAFPADGFAEIAKAAHEGLNNDSDTVEADMDESRITKIEENLQETSEKLAKLESVPETLQKLSDALEAKAAEEKTPTADELKGEVQELAKSVKGVAESLSKLDERIDAIAEGDTDQPDDGEPIAKSKNNDTDELLASIL